MSAARTAPPPYDYGDLARLTGVRLGTLRQWRNRGKLPEPTRYVGQSPAWDRAKMKGWLAEHGYRTED